jgi:hypothetical protein
MKRGGLLVAAFVLFGGMLRFSAPSTQTERSSANATKYATKSATVTASASGTAEQKSAFERSLSETINAFYGNKYSSPSLLSLATSGIGKSHEEPRFLIALVPDPVHTHLSMHFDRTVRSIQTAVQHADGYSFDRAILPWKYTVQNPNETLTERQAEEAERKLRETFPGLLLFRGNPSPLFVFLVGERPTSGLNNLQFQNTLRIIRKLRSQLPSNVSSIKHPLLIMGPSFSGSLESLGAQLLEANLKQDYSEILVYSGSTTNKVSEDKFTKRLSSESSVKLHFAPFQQNDEFSITQFLRFAYCRGYSPKEIAVLSEGDTAYGNFSGTPNPEEDGNDDNSSDFHVSEVLFPCADGNTQPDFEKDASHIVRLTFPREISFFRSAYEKEQASKQEALAKIPGKSVVPLDIEEEGDEGDAVPLFAGSQTALSQEAVMLGIVSELQKHHIKFTILLATNPVDQLFLARYLRTSYPQGRVVVTTPDLLLVSQEDTLLQGVLGLNVYSLVPGQNDLLCGIYSTRRCHDESALTSEDKIPAGAHQDRLFESATDVGTFNATLALLAAAKSAHIIENEGAEDACAKNPCWAKDSLPDAEYEEYAAPCPVPNKDNPKDCPRRPLLWLTILGQDGYWPIAALSDEEGMSKDARLPISFATSRMQLENSLKKVDSSNSSGNTAQNSDSQKSAQSDPVPSGKVPKSERPEESHTTPAWNIAYCICVLGFLIHGILSCTGTFLSNWEWKAQFANTHDTYGTSVIAVGAFLLVAAFVLVMFARSPLVAWTQGAWLTVVLWLPLPFFIGAVIWDLINRRNSKVIASVFAISSIALAAVQLNLSFQLWSHFHTLWSTRYLHFASGVSPIPPFFFLLAAGYWWTWLSLRGMSIVDLRRPRLPGPSTLPPLAFRMSDTEGEKVRDTAHPVKFAWRVLLVTAGICIVSLTLLDLRHPLQSLEGSIYDWGYCVLLALTLAVFIGCLIRMASTWFAYKQVLTGLDRSPLREAFSRMKRLTWKSMWNPGGSTLRETYRVMSRMFENLEKLERVEPEFNVGSTRIRDSIRLTNAAYSGAIAIYGKLMRYIEKSPSLIPPAAPEGDSSGQATSGATNNPTAVPATATARIETPVAGAFSVPIAARGSAAVAVAPAKEPNVENGVVQSDVQMASQTAQIQELKEGNLLSTVSVAAPPETETPASKESKSSLYRQLVCQIETLQIRMADTAGYLVSDFLTPEWRKQEELVVSEESRVEKEKLPFARALAEEYVSLVYVNFLQSVLLQMRSLVICAAGMYVLIVCSINIYPFEPHPALQVLAVALILVMGAAVGFVYAEMHRDAILSRLTSTNAGELGWDFWWKFISAGAVPVFSLLAVQFPEIGRFLFSWLAPALQSAK